MILDDDNMISLLDSGFGGMYPRFFEIAILPYLNTYD